MALGPRLGNAPAHGIIPSMGWGVLGCPWSRGAAGGFVVLFCPPAEHCVCCLLHPLRITMTVPTAPSRPCPQSTPARRRNLGGGGKRETAEHSEGALGVAPVLITFPCPQCPSETHWANWDQGTLGLKGLNAGGGDEYHGRIS